MPEGKDENVEDMPPSVKLIVKTLQHEAPLTQKELSRSTLLPSRTVRYAINRLEKVGAINSKTNMHDARQQVYDLPNLIQSGETTTDTPRSNNASKKSSDETSGKSSKTEGISDQDLLGKIQSEFEKMDI